MHCDERVMKNEIIKFVGAETVCNRSCNRFAIGCGDHLTVRSAC